MQQIRVSLRGSAVVLMGKNTMMRKAIKGHLDRNPALEKVLPHIKGNVGFVFTRGDLVEVRDKLLENKVRAPARPGAIAPLSVIIPAQNTGLGPEKTSFFQALSIPTKISKGTIEIINDVHILKPGDKVGASEATLLNMLNISPFSYGLIVEQVYDSGTIFAPEILDIKPEDLREKFLAGVANLAAVCLSIGYPTVASAPHSIVNGFKNLLAIAAVTDIEFKEAQTVKEYLKVMKVSSNFLLTHNLTMMKSMYMRNFLTVKLEIAEPITVNCFRGLESYLTLKLYINYGINIIFKY